MIIAKSAVREFESRRLTSYDWLKQMPRKDLIRQIRALDPQPVFESPYKHRHCQLVGFFVCVCLDGFLLFYDVGAGKTRIFLEAFAYRQLEGKVDQGLVLCFDDTGAEEWRLQAKIHTPSLKVQPLIGSTERRWDLFRNVDADIYTISYMGMVHWLGRKRKKKLKKKKSAMEPNPAAIKEVLSRIQFLLADEVDLLSNPDSLFFRLAKRLADGVEFRYGCTGTPTGRDPQLFWSQFNLVDDGETLGETLGIFRAAFFDEKENYWGGHKYTFNDRKEKALRRRMRNRSIVYEKKDIEANTLRHVRRLSRPATFDKYYSAAIKELVRAHTMKREDVKKLQSSFTRLRMLTSGYLTHSTDEDRVQVDFPENPKLEALDLFVHNIAPGKKAIVWHEFIHTGELISARLNFLGVPHVVVRGGLGDKKQKAVDQFREDPKMRVVVANWMSIARSLNLQIADYMLFVESPTSPRARLQCEGRARAGENHKVYVEDVVIRGTVDEKVIDFLSEGKDVIDSLVRGGLVRELEDQACQ